MNIVISHMSALELLRSPALADALASPRPLPLRVPEGVPCPAELAEKSRELSGLGIDGRPLELLVNNVPARARTGMAMTHIRRGPLPASSFIRIADGIWSVSPEHLCVQLATRLTRIELLVLMGELLGTYALPESGMYSREKPCMTRSSLARHLDDLGKFDGVRATKWALPLAPENSASPMETKLFLRVSLPARLGGYALPVRSMNERLEVGRVGEQGQAGERRPDIVLLPKEGASVDCAFIALEYDGQGHLTRAQQAADQRRSNDILAFGGREYRVNKELYDNLGYMDDLMRLVAADLGRKPGRVTHAVGEKRLRKRGELKRELDLIDGISWGGKARAKASADDGDGPVGEEVPLDAYWF